MTETKTALQIGDSFHMGRLACSITQVSKFGPEEHYGFTWVDDDGKLHAGWMPVCFVDNFTGYDLGKVEIMKGAA